MTSIVSWSMKMKIARYFLSILKLNNLRCLGCRSSTWRPGWNGFSSSSRFCLSNLRSSFRVRRYATSSEWSGMVRMVLFSRWKTWNAEYPARGFRGTTGCSGRRHEVFLSRAFRFASVVERTAPVLLQTWGVHTPRRDLSVLRIEFELSLQCAYRYYSITARKSKQTEVISCLAISPKLFFELLLNLLQDFVWFFFILL